MESAKSARSTAVLDLFKTVKEIDAPRSVAPSIFTDPAQVSVLVREADTLSTANDEIEKQAETARGNGPLYEWLGNVYDYGLRVKTSPMAVRDEVIKQLREAVNKRTGRKLDPATPLMTLVVKYVVKTEHRQTTHIYSRALRVAESYGVAAGGFAQYVKDKEGLSQLLITKEEEDRRQKQSAKVQLLRASLWEAASNAEPIDWPSGVKLAGADENAPMGEFTLVVAQNDATGLRLGAAFKLPKLVEDSLMNSFSAAVSDEKVNEPEKT